jgi:CRP-like cAMP-binding protein
MAESPQLKKLKDQLELAMEKERLKEAVEALEKLERLEPAEPRWSQRLGDLLRRQKQTAQAIQAYERAVDRYAKGGFLARAVAMAKTITSLDPTRKDVLSRLQQNDAKDIKQKANLSRARASLGPAAPASAPPAARPSAPPVPLSLVPAPVSTVSLRPMPASSASLAPPPANNDEAEVFDDETSGARLTLVHAPVMTALAPDELEILYVEDEASAAGQDEEARTAERLAVLPLFALFSDVPHEALLDMVAESELIELSPGQLVVRTGDAADALFGIVSGSVRVQVPRAIDEEAILLGEGEVFGEACLLTDEPRHADVLAETELVALRIPKSTLDALLGEHAQVGRVLMQLLVQRLLGNLVRTSPLFTTLDPDMRREAVALFELRKAPHDTVLFEAGLRGDGLYVPLTGTLHVALFDGSVRYLPPGSVVGSASLLSHAAIPHTVRTLGDTLLLRLSSMRFMELVTHFPTVLERLSELSLSDAMTEM